jgi:hypothetical protein
VLPKRQLTFRHKDKTVYNHRPENNKSSMAESLFEDDDDSESQLKMYSLLCRGYKIHGTDFCK